MTPWHFVANQAWLLADVTEGKWSHSEWWEYFLDGQSKRFIPFQKAINQTILETHQTPVKAKAWYRFTCLQRRDPYRVQWYLLPSKCAQDCSSRDWNFFPSDQNDSDLPPPPMLIIGLWNKSMHGCFLRPSKWVTQTLISLLILNELWGGSTNYYCSWNMSICNQGSTFICSLFSLCSLISKINHLLMRGM